MKLTILKTSLAVLLTAQLSGCYTTSEESVSRQHYQSADIEHTLATKVSACFIELCKPSEEIRHDYEDMMLFLESNISMGTNIRTFEINGTRGFILSLDNLPNTFDYNSNELSNTLKSSIDTVAKTVNLSRNDIERVLVLGHASYDSKRIRSKLSNLQISKYRTDAVSSYLAHKLADLGYTGSEIKLIRKHAFGDRFAKHFKSPLKKDQRVDIVFVL